MAYDYTFLFLQKKFFESCFELRQNLSYGILTFNLCNCKIHQRVGGQLDTSYFERYAVSQALKIQAF